MHRRDRLPQLSSWSLAVSISILTTLACTSREPRSPPEPDNPAASDAPPTSAGTRLKKPAPRIEKHGFLKGSTHAHTNRSADSDTSVHDAVRWYRQHDYDFVVITDHDRITEYTGAQDLLVLPGVELTNNPSRCWPPPEPGFFCRVHVNALFVSGHEQLAHVQGHPGPESGRVRWDKRGHVWRVDMYSQALSETRALGGLAQINHPTWYRGVDGILLAELARRGAGFVEIANQAFASWNEGDVDHPSAEAIWDHALTAGLAIWGVASDDAHHYDDARDRRPWQPVYPAGTGFVMVRAEPSPAAIRAAMERGDFYSSTGVYLAAIDIDKERLAIAVESPGPHEIAFIGTRDGIGGQLIDRRRGRRAEIARPMEGYVRAVITDDAGRKAWVQPVFARPRDENRPDQPKAGR